MQILFSRIFIAAYSVFTKYIALEISDLCNYFVTMYCLKVVHKLTLLLLFVQSARISRTVLIFAAHQLMIKHVLSVPQTMEWEWENQRLGT